MIMQTDEEIRPPRVLVVLAGDMVNDPESYIKYNTFIQALKRRFQVVDVYNAKLRGFRRLLNLAASWHPDLNTWVERASKNIFAFRLRSKQASNYVRSMQNRADAIVQLGVLFDAGWDGPCLPNIIYTDYTAQLSARRRDAGRSPLRGEKLQRWFDIEGRTMKNSAHVCVRSRLVGKSVTEDYGLGQEQVSVIGGGANLEIFPAFAPRLPGNKPTILFIGIDFYRKGGDLVLNAFARVRQSAPNVELLFVTHDQIPEDMPLEGVKLVAPTWNREEILRLYEQSNIFVLPSRLETWGDVILEAMAYGLPCVGVTGQSMEEIIRNEDTGFLVPPEDVDALAQALLRLVTDDKLFLRMQKAGYELAFREFTWDRVVDRLAPAVYTALESRRGFKG